MSAKVAFTTTRVATFVCPADKTQAFLWDNRAPGLGLRVTASGARAYIFQTRLRDSGQSVRMTIGKPLDSDGRGTWSIPDAQREARRLQTLVDQGRDPRQELKERSSADRLAREADLAERARLETRGLDAWLVYCEARQGAWSERNYRDHLAFAAAGGVKRKRSALTTQAGPLHALLSRPLASIDEDVVHEWAAKESKVRPTRARLGFRLLRAFLNWCAEHKEYRAIANPGACARKSTRETLGRAGAKCDSLQKEQLGLWFHAVRQDSNVVVAAYLQALLLTGARREELASLQWRDVDFQWQSMTIRDKVEGTRQIPLTPYVARLLSSLPRPPGNPYVFSSPTARSGRLQDARANHVRALQAAGLPHVTLHGLRRSFGTLSEWVEVPVGVVAQIQGHRPSAIAEKHYRVRQIDMLRKWHMLIETWMLEQAGLPQRAHPVAARQQPDMGPCGGGNVEVSTQTP